MLNGPQAEELRPPPRPSGTNEPSTREGDSLRLVHPNLPTTAVGSGGDRSSSNQPDPAPGHMVTVLPGTETGERGADSPGHKIGRADGWPDRGHGRETLPRAMDGTALDSEGEHSDARYDCTGRTRRCPHGRPPTRPISCAYVESLRLVPPGDRRHCDQPTSGETPGGLPCIGKGPSSTARNALHSQSGEAEPGRTHARVDAILASRSPDLAVMGSRMSRRVGLQAPEHSLRPPATRRGRTRASGARRNHSTGRSRLGPCRAPTTRGAGTAALPRCPGLEARGTRRPQPGGESGPGPRGVAKSRMPCTVAAQSGSVVAPHRLASANRPRCPRPLGVGGISWFPDGARGYGPGMLERCRAVVTQRRIHGALTVVWLVLAYPSVVYWRNSVPWLVGVSVYANVVGHWSAFEATKATEAAES